MANENVFGKHLREDFYLLDKNYHFTNHGSYGAIPKPIYEKRQKLQLEFESVPDAWFRFKIQDLWYNNRKYLADFLNVNVDNLLITENVTDGINSVLKSIDFNGCNDVILVNKYTYGAVKNTVNYISKYRFKECDQVSVVDLPSIHPVKSLETFLNDFDNACGDVLNNRKQNLRLVIIDHITSATATLQPVKEMIKIVRKWEKQANSKIIILVDGAHTIGQIELNLSELDCDFYVSNLHKWFFAPRGCSFLYFTDNKQLSILKPNIVSHFFDKDASICFLERGTRDNTNFLLIEECIKFQKFLGGYQKIKEYNTSLLEKAVKMLTESWNTSTLDMPKEFEAPFMRNIKLPKICESKTYTNEELSQVALSLGRRLYDEFKIIAMPLTIDSQIYIRICAFVYNTMDDYYRLRDVILEISKQFS